LLIHEADRTVAQRAEQFERDLFGPRGKFRSSARWKVLCSATVRRAGTEPTRRRKGSEEVPLRPRHRRPFNSELIG
jgi:hypothetical protein